MLLRRCRCSSAATPCDRAALLPPPPPPLPRLHLHARRVAAATNTNTACRAAAASTSAATAPAHVAPEHPSSSSSSFSQQVHEYNHAMHAQMQWGSPFEYHPQRGLYWHAVADRLICGTQLRCASDVAELGRAGVTHIVSLQTDKDLQDWSVDLRELQSKCSDLGMQLMRCSARDFDPHSLRQTLPRAVASVHQALLQQGSKVYVHCTAGLGRAPAVCIAYMFWFRLDMDLDEAYRHVTSIRPCGPKRDAIRGATFDLAGAGVGAAAFEQLGPDAWASLPEEDKYALQWRLLKAAAA